MLSLQAISDFQIFTKRFCHQIAVHCPSSSSELHVYLNLSENMDVRFVGSNRSAFI
jgi:hypothetical protein